MFIKVTQCSFPCGWYKDDIDAIFEVDKVEHFGKTMYKVVDLPLEDMVTGYYIEIGDGTEVPNIG